MILPLGATSLDTAYQFPNFYGFGYGVGGRIALRQLLTATPPVLNKEIRDIVTLSPAAQRIIEQTERLAKMSKKRSKK